MPYGSFIVTYNCSERYACVAVLSDLMYSKHPQKFLRVYIPTAGNFILFKVVGVVSVSVDFFLHNMLGYTELNVDTTKNHQALMSYFVNPLKMQSFWKSP